MAALLFRFYTLARISSLLTRVSAMAMVVAFIVFHVVFQFLLMRENAYGLQYSLHPMCFYPYTSILSTVYGALKIQKKTRQTEILMAR